ncbi:hypothetical protein [Raoultibacter phocaeensis]|uniref:hypothetical protein n=1 Tax=Raoultibacter phocaeensis TaxID=2479841 RepID=UPI001119A552|nr:hypothetical protein [Raoultibacter phocaeensis]
MSETAAAALDGTRNAIRRTCLDGIEVAHRDTVYPIVFCHATLSGALDIRRLEDAVSQSARLVPEVLYAYEYRTGRFVDRGFPVSRAMLIGSDDFGEGWRWDFGTGPQLKLSVMPRGETTEFVVALSHILSDGRGF